MTDETNRLLLENLDKLHTTSLGVERIKKNLALKTTDIVNWCRDRTANEDNIIRKGKNWYVYANNAVITINAHSYTIITAHKSLTT